jgi:hypothetical protein
MNTGKTLACEDATAGGTVVPSADRTDTLEKETQR